MNYSDPQVAWENILQGSVLVVDFLRGSGIGGGPSWASQELKPSSKGKG